MLGVQFGVSCVVQLVVIVLLEQLIIVILFDGFSLVDGVLSVVWIELSVVILYLGLVVKLVVWFLVLGMMMLQLSSSSVVSGIDFVLYSNVLMLIILVMLWLLVIICDGLLYGFSELQVDWYEIVWLLLIGLWIIDVMLMIGWFSVLWV